MTSRLKVLLVEDNRGIVNTLVSALERTYDIDVAMNAKSALHKADNELYEMFILDLNLPDFSGAIVCQQLRERGYTAPILIISAENKPMVKINLLDSGANDYLMKPFSLGELKARLRVLHRNRIQAVRPAKEILVGDLVLNRRTFSVRRGEVEIDLRRKGFALLECLMERAGSTVSRDMLTRSAWHNTSDLWTNTIDVHIKHLRDKIDRPFDYPLIKTIHGRGYKIEVRPRMAPVKEPQL